MVVRMRHTRAHTRNRRSHHALSAARFTHCKKCGESVMPHVVCTNCGTYSEREIIDVLKKLNKKEKKKKEKELSAQGGSASGGKEKDKPLDATSLSNK